MSFVDRGPTGIEKLVCEDIAARQRLGIVKYGVTVADNPLNLEEWLEHQYEELLDAAVYAKAALERLRADRIANAVAESQPAKRGFVRRFIDWVNND